MSNRLTSLNNWLQTGLGITDYKIEKASEDASFRRYYRISVNNNDAIVMDAPPDKEDCSCFVDIAERLVAAGLYAPRIKAENRTEGFLLLDDLGTTLYLDVLNDSTADELYGDALEAMVVMQGKVNCEGLPLYTHEKLMGEMGLFRDWLLHKHFQLTLEPETSHMLDQCFEYLANSAIAQPQVFVHRDYHSRNLMQTSMNNPGILDFQDAVAGPITYDLVSLLKDCYIKWPSRKLYAWVEDYHSRVCSRLDIAIDLPIFIQWFDLMGVQRHLKASGIFARLSHRDNKKHFMKDVPRTLSYITDLKNKYAELDPLIHLIEKDIMPRLEKGLIP
jgi:aminoglycoside/choline kinase family phosphotransferase